MDSGRRNFFGNVILGGTSLFFGLEANEQPELPIKNPFHVVNCDCDTIAENLKFSETKRGFILENEFIRISTDSNTYIHPKVPMIMQDLYSAMKLLWMMERKLMKYPFPFVAITPEMYEVVDGWSLSIENIRQAGVIQTEPHSKSPSEYIGISVLSQEGMVYNSRQVELLNGGLLSIHNGRVNGWYRKYTSEKLIPLQEHLEKTIAVKDLTYTYYRIP